MTGHFGLPAEAIGLILATDRVLDMARTRVNVFSDACGAVVIARTEGETPLATAKAE
jgi:Na+/H+-dicarboxylate symporter